MSTIDLSKKAMRISVALGLMITLQGCVAEYIDPLGLKDSPASPRVRMSCYATATFGTKFIDPNDLGLHSRKKSRAETNGIVYTCRGGHIDIAHVRKAADWTAYLANKALRMLRQGDTEMSFKFWEPTRYFVQIDYPPNWQDLPQSDKDAIAREVSIRLGQCCAHTGLVWHEILTWFGYRPTVWYREFPSAFSWEDAYSNLLGTHLAVQAMHDTDHPYEEAMTLALWRMLEQLEVRARDTAILASKQMKGRWYTGDILFLVEIFRRNLDIGLDDGFVAPVLVPALCDCPDAQPLACPAPSLASLAEYGFSATLEIEPREWQTGRIKQIVFPDRGVRKKTKRLEPDVHFPPIMEYIRQDAIRRYGPIVNAESPAEIAYMDNP